MILYGAPNPAPNPRRVRIFLAEKGIDLPETRVDMMKREHKSPEFRAKNSMGQLPALELDERDLHRRDGRDLPLLRRDEPRAADVRDHAGREGDGRHVGAPHGVHRDDAGRQLLAPRPPARTAALLTQFKDFGESNKEIYTGAQRYLNRELEGRTWLAGEHYSMADICLLTTVDFAGWIGLPLEEEYTNLKAWHDRVSARPSAAALALGKATTSCREGRPATKGIWPITRYSGAITSSATRPKV